MNLISQVSTVNSLINFVTGKQMHEALTAIGDNHFRTAEGVLRNLPNVRDQAALLRIGISHLEGAHTAYKEQWNSSNFLVQLSEAFFTRFPIMVACKKDVYTCCLLAACYAYLQEEELVYLAIEHAEATQEKFVERWGKEDYNESLSDGLIRGGVEISAILQRRKIPQISLPDYKNNLLRILPELCNRESPSQGKPLLSLNQEVVSLVRTLTLTGHTGIVTSVAFRPDGQTLASSSEDKTIKLWNLTSGQAARTLRGHTNLVSSVAFSPDGQTLASSSDDKTIKLWNLTSGQELHTLTEHTSYVYSVAFSPDGQILASSSDDKTIKLWNLSTGQEVRTLRGHIGHVSSVAFSPDGQTLASSSGDKTIKIWGKK